MNVTTDIILAIFSTFLAILTAFLVDIFAFRRRRENKRHADAIELTMHNISANVFESELDAKIFRVKYAKSVKPTKKVLTSEKQKYPPQKAEKALLLLTSYKEQDEILGDLHQLYDMRREKYGSTWANTWFCMQISGTIISQWTNRLVKIFVKIRRFIP